MKKFLFLLFFTTSLLLGEGFAPETFIKTPDGYAPIEHIETGQIIESYDSKNNEIASHPVIAKHSYTATNYLVIKLESEDITCSLNQKFYLHALDKWIKAKELLNNEKIRNLFCDELSVVDIIKIDNPKELHTLTINPHHNFYITESDILAHNFAPAIVIPIITISAGDGVILFGGLGVAGVTGIVYREAIVEMLQGVVRNFNGESHNNPPSSPEQPGGGGYDPGDDYNPNDNKSIPNPFNEDYVGNFIRNFAVPGSQMGHLLNNKHNLEQIGSSARSIVGTVSNLIKDIDKMGKVAEGANRIQTWVGGTPVEIRYFIQNQTVINMDAFINHSPKPYFNTVVLP